MIFSAINKEQHVRKKQKEKKKIPFFAKPFAHNALPRGSVRKEQTARKQRVVTPSDASGTR